MESKIITDAVLSSEALPATVPALTAYERGWVDAANNEYHPPLTHDRDSFDSYMRGWNNCWAEQNNRRLLR